MDSRVGSVPPVDVVYSHLKSSPQCPAKPSLGIFRPIRPFRPIPFRSLPLLEFPPPLSYLSTMPDTASPLVLPEIEHDEQTDENLEPGYLVVCWDDPVNLMDYVTHVFQKVFGWDRKKAEFHMLQVHNQGKSILTRESMEKAEHYVHQLQKYTLHATMERA